MEVEKRHWCGVWIELYQSMDESTAGPFSRMASQLAAPLDRIESDRR
jgi:hypothetical protein